VSSPTPRYCSTPHQTREELHQKTYAAERREGREREKEVLVLVHDEIFVLELEIQRGRLRSRQAQYATPYVACGAATKNRILITKKQKK
jgi:hypothetical protein